MKVMIKIIIYMIMAITTLTLAPTNWEPSFTRSKLDSAAKRVSRFLQQTASNPRIARPCNEDNRICGDFSGGGNATCCNGKCVETGSDPSNCGVCGKKCAFREACCRRECVNLAYDNRHCGFCNNMCKNSDGGCVYGICDYAS